MAMIAVEVVLAVSMTSRRVIPLPNNLTPHGVPTEVPEVPVGVGPTNRQLLLWPSKPAASPVAIKELFRVR